MRRGWEMGARKWEIGVTSRIWILDFRFWNQSQGVWYLVDSSNRIKDKWAASNWALIKPQASSLKSQVSKLGIKCVQAWVQAVDKVVYGHTQSPQLWVQNLIGQKYYPHYPQTSHRLNHNLTDQLYTTRTNKLSGVETEISPPSTGLINTIITLYNKRRTIA